MSQSYKVISVQIGVAQPLQVNGRKILSGIRKYPITGPIRIHTLGLEGDEQVNLSIHGGLAKAIYAYPSEHYPFWQEDQKKLGVATSLHYGALGENLTLSGLLEDDLFVGDELHFPDCLLRVTQPREPCSKFNAVMQDRAAAKKMLHTGFCGFYLAVDSAGTIAAGQHFELKPGLRKMPIRELLKKAILKNR